MVGELLDRCGRRDHQAESGSRDLLTDNPSFLSSWEQTRGENAILFFILRSTIQDQHDSWTITHTMGKSAPLPESADEFKDYDIWECEEESKSWLPISGAFRCGRPAPSWRQPLHILTCPLPQSPATAHQSGQRWAKGLKLRFYIKPGLGLHKFVFNLVDCPIKTVTLAPVFAGPPAEGWL